MKRAFEDGVLMQRLVPHSEARIAEPEVDRQN